MRWPLVMCRPGPDPLESLAVALAAHPVIATRLAAVGEVVSRLRADPRTVHLTTRLALHDAPDTQRVLVLVDQLEEIFTVCRDDALRQGLPRHAPFMPLVSRGADSGGGDLAGGFLWQVRRLPALAGAVAEHQMLVGPLAPEEYARL